MKKHHGCLVVLMLDKNQNITHLARHNSGIWNQKALDCNACAPGLLFFELALKKMKLDN
jgi:hypothetical protein